MEGDVVSSVAPHHAGGAAAVVSDEAAGVAVVPVLLDERPPRVAVGALRGATTLGLRLRLRHLLHRAGQRPVTVPVSSQAVALHVSSQAAALHVSSQAVALHVSSQAVALRRFQRFPIDFPESAHDFFAHRSPRNAHLFFSFH